MRNPKMLIAIVLAVIGIQLYSDVSVGATIVAVVVAALFLRFGFNLLGGLAQPIPEPPPAGELRKVKVEFRCSICGTELRVTTANDEMPDPPKHCLEEMDLVTPVE